VIAGVRLVRRVAVALIALGLTVATVSGCTHTKPSAAPASAARQVSITVSPRTTLIDAPVTVTVTGLSPGQQVTLHSSATDAEGALWQASARFRVPAGGVVTTDQASLGGSYTGVDPMGLFDMMAPPADEPMTSTFNPVGATDGYPVTLTADLGGSELAQTTAQRTTYLSKPLKLTNFAVRTSGIYGELFQPKDTTTPRPAVLLFGGSEGGISVETLAGQLAAHGYPALALGYFSAEGAPVPGLPSELENIPLEYFVKALRILRKQPGVDPHHVLVYGDSRGSEAALLLGADFPTLVNGVIAGVPSAVVQRGYGAQAAWTLHGRPIQPIEAGLGDVPAAFASSGAMIPVEKIRGPVMLVCGGLDDVWISCPYQQAIVKRLRTHHFRYPVTALSYQQAGHYVGDMIAYFPVTAAFYQGTGGSLQANQEAVAQAHAQLLRFLASQ
jgi:dienelactone hydrolase